MNPIRRIYRSAVIAAALAAVLLTSGTMASVAYAIQVPAQGGTGDPAQIPSQVQTIAAGGMPGWQITLIAAGAAILAAAAAVVLDRARTAHRHLTVPNG